MEPKTIIVDTCIIISMVAKNDIKHEETKNFHQLLTQEKIEVIIPAHAFFEMSAVIKNKKDCELNEGFSLNIKCRDITEEFVHNYINAELPYIKGSDLIFLSIAFKEKIPLITADETLYKKAKEATVEVYRPHEFLSLYN